MKDALDGFKLFYEDIPIKRKKETKNKRILVGRIRNRHFGHHLISVVLRLKKFYRRGNNDTTRD